MLKQKRQQTILNLIRTQNISTQEELTMLLSKDDFSVTQSSVSRDLEQLGIIKINGFYALPQTSERSLEFGLLSLETAGESLIVAKCHSGLASAVAVRIDSAKIAEIVGTIAGDDTIFIAVKDVKTQKATIKKIWEIFEK
jgi:transcriptional regulator of arginine metabolism